MPTLISDALARARSSAVPGPDLRPPAHRRAPGVLVAVPAALDRLLARSVAGARLRPAASAGALHPVDVLLLMGAGSGVRPGRYLYRPAEHRLQRVAAAPVPAPPGVFAVLHARAERTVAHYRHRGWPLVLLDTGHTVAALVAAGAPAFTLDLDGRVLLPRTATGRATAVGLSTGRPATGCATAVGPSTDHPSTDRPATEPGGAVLAVVRLTRDGTLDPWCVPATTGAPGPTPVPPPAPVPVPAQAPVPAPAQAPVPAQEPGPPPAQVPARAQAPVPAPVPAPARDSASPGTRSPQDDDLAEAARILARLAAAGKGTGSWTTPRAPAAPDAVLLGRRSADPDVLATAGRPSSAALALLLEAAVSAAPDGPRWCVAVGGPAPGLLRLEGDTLTTLATGPVLPTLAVWAAGQRWIAATGAVLLAHGCPWDATPARVRREHLLAGYGAGRAQLTATALGLVSRPVGSWQQADLGARLGGPPGRDWIVHALAVGTPAASDGGTARTARTTQETNTR
ncbi:nitroreductase [Streptomyces uncialis]|uniref:nitroreductase n=1 Tax=Streptomyces uncialis TaxID=1048205 RepID=UPI002E2EC50A|nr:nitroreductase [Streptomyces uncialis]